MKAVVAAFDQEKALVGAFSVIVQPVVELMDRFAALITTHTRCVSPCPRHTVIDNGKPGPRPARGGLVFNIMKGKVVFMLQASERKCKARTIIINKDYKMKI